MSFKQELCEIYNSRPIIRSLVIKNLFGQYRNSALGFAWHFVMPVVMMIVYYVVFTSVRINPIPNFWVYMSSGLFPFTFMITNLTVGAGCIVNNSTMIKKMYFPRSIFVIAQIISSFITMLLGYSIVLIAIVVSGYGVSIFYVMLIPFFVMMLIFALGYCLIFSSLTVYSRDVNYLLNSFSIVFYFITPVYFTVEGTGILFNLVVSLNPFAYYVDFLHQIIYAGALPGLNTILVCSLLPIITLVVGIIVFRKLKNGFVERL